MGNKKNTENTANKKNIANKNMGELSEISAKLDRVLAASSGGEVIMSLINIIARQNEIIATYRESIDVLGKAVASLGNEDMEPDDNFHTELAGHDWAAEDKW